MSPLKFSFILLVVFLLAGCGSSRLVLQGRGDSKYGHIFSARPDENRRTYYFFDARAWTWYAQGIGEGVTRSLIDFDLRGVPRRATIIEAKLYLYQDKERAVTNDPTRHRTLSGPNDCLLQRITSPWDPETLTWNNQPSTTTENQVIVPASQDSVQNYLIDCTALIRDISGKRDSSYGIMLRLVNETRYRSLVFSSPFDRDSTLSPKLEILYK